MSKLWVYILAILVFYFGFRLCAEVEVPSFKILANDSIHCEIGHNYANGTRGVIHLWKRNVPGGYELPDAPFDVMQNGEYDYVKVDDNWFIENGENPDINKLFGIIDSGNQNTDSTCVLIFSKPQFEVIKEIQPLIKKSNNLNERLPVIKVTYSIRNTTSESHQYTIYHADDYSLGGVDHGTYIGYSDKSFAYKQGIYDSLKVSALIKGSETKCIISKLNCDNPIEKQFYTFLGIADTSAEFYVNYANKVMARQFVVNEDILTYKQISVGIKYNIGTLAPGQIKKVWFYLGVSRSWSGINQLAGKVLESGAVNVTITPDNLNLPESEKNFQTTLQIKNNSDLNIHLNNVTMPAGINFINLKTLSGEPFPGAQGLDIQPNGSVFCRLQVVQPDYYKNGINLSFNYDAEGGTSGSAITRVNLNRQAPQTTDFLLRGGVKDGTVEYTDQYLVIDGKVDDSQSGSSLLDSCTYFDNGTTPQARVGAFRLENISYNFTDKIIPMPQNWEPGSTHKVYFRSKDQSGLKGRFFVNNEYDSLLVNVRPQVKFITPSSGEFKDPVNLVINAGIYDSLTVQWTDNLTNPVWQNIYQGTSSTYNWMSGLNTPQIWLRARVRKVDLFSAWLTNSQSVLIDNQPPQTVTDYTGNSSWQKTPLTIRFARTDNLSNFDNTGRTYYALNAGMPSIVLAAPFHLTLNQNFNNFLSYNSIDDAGNIESVQRKRIRIDVAAPRISAVSLPDLNSADSTAYRFQIKGMDYFSGLKRDSVQFSWRYGDLNWQSKMLSSTDSIFSDSIAAPTGGWVGFMNSYLQMSVSVVDSAGNRQNWAYDELIQYKNKPPRFATPIQDQTIVKMQNFSAVDLRTYIADEWPDSVRWEVSASNPGDFNISLTNGYLFKIQAATPLTVGSCSVIFKMLDQENEFALDTATFTVLDQNYAPVISGLTGQTVAFGQPFTAINLDPLVLDPDHTDNLLSWSTNASAPLKITIDPVTRLCTIVTESAPGVVDNTIALDQVVTFTVKDPLNAEAGKSVTFKRGNYPVTVLEIDNQTVPEDNLFFPIKMSDYLIAQNMSDWHFSFSTDSLNFFNSDPAARFSLTYGADDYARVSCAADSSGKIYIRFKAQDINGFADSSDAKFTVLPVNDAPFFTGSVTQQIAHQAQFTPINLYRLVSDKETPEGPFTFSALPSAVYNTEITVIAPDSVIAKVSSQNPLFNGSVADSITFVVKDSSGSAAVKAFAFSIKPDTLRLRIPDQTIALGESFYDYILSTIVTNFTVNPLALNWNFQHLLGDIIASAEIDTANSKLKISALPDKFGLELLEVTISDSLMQQTVRDTVALRINYLNQPPLIVLDPATPLSINQGVELFPARKIFRLDDLTLPDSLQLTLRWHSAPAVFAYDTLALLQDSIKVRVLGDSSWTGSDSLLLTLTDRAGLQDSVWALYRVSTVNNSPLLTTFPLYDLTGLTEKKIYLDKYVSDANNSDDEINWAFENSTYLDLDSTGTEADSGQFVIVKVRNDFTGQKNIRFTATDPLGAFATQNVKFSRGFALPSMQVTDTTSTNPQLAALFLNDLFAKAVFPLNADSARVGLNENLNDQLWQPLRSDNSLIFSFVAAEKRLARNTLLKFYGQVKQNGLSSYVATDSIIYDNTAPQGSFYLESLSGSTSYTQNDTVRIKPVTFSPDIYRYAYSKTGPVSVNDIALFEDSLRQKYVLDDSGWLYITLLDSAGNTYTASDNIRTDKYPPELVLTKPDLNLLVIKHNYYPYANLQIAGFDSSFSMQKLTLKSAAEEKTLTADDFSGDSLKFNTTLRLNFAMVDTIKITAADSLGNTQQIRLPIVYDPYHYGPVIKLTSPVLQNNSAVAFASPGKALQIAGYDSTATADSVFIKYREQSKILTGTQLLAGNKSFKSDILLAEQLTDTVRVEAADFNGYRGRVAFPVSFSQKRHFVLTLNGDGYNDFCYFETGEDKSAEVKIFTLRGDLITSLKYNQSRQEPPKWDGRDKQNSTVPGGLYLFVVNSKGKETSGTIAVVR